MQVNEGTANDDSVRLSHFDTTPPTADIHYIEGDSGKNEMCLLDVEI